MADDVKSEPPPRRPGPARPHDVYVTTQVRFALALLAASPAVLVIALALEAGGTSLRAALIVSAMLLILGIAALIHVARVGWRGRR